MKLREIQQRVDGPEPAGLRGTHETSRDGAARWSAPLPQPWRWEIQTRMGGSASAGPRLLLLILSEEGHVVTYLDFEEELVL